MNSYNLSFIIITDGNKPFKLLNQVQSIRYQKINNYEIIIVGNPNTIFYNQSDIHIIEDHNSAKNGNLSAMRNKACDIAKNDYIVISDDDMLFSLRWYDTLSSYDKSFDILTPCVQLPDGTRFWDHCCYNSPIHGQKILETFEQDDHLYMSGGQSWIMNKKVFQTIRWNEDLKFYAALQNSKLQNEDTDFAERCRSHGYKISHFHELIVYHDDITYTGFGRNVFRRKCQDLSWIFLFQNQYDVLNMLLHYFYANKYYAEFIDIGRLIQSTYPEIKNEAIEFILALEKQQGGKLSDSMCVFDNVEYKETLKEIYK